MQHEDHNLIGLLARYRYDVQYLEDESVLLNAQLDEACRLIRVLLATCEECPECGAVRGADLGELEHSPDCPAESFLMNYERPVPPLDGERRGNL